jgi:CheY-like chemotaxis protein
MNGVDDIAGGGFPTGQPRDTWPGAERATLAKDGFLAGLKILLVEDHDDTRIVFQAILSQKGHSVKGVADGKAALALAGSQAFDLVISDLGLPGLSGTELMTILRERYSLRGVALSGYGMEEDIRKSKAAGFDYHLTKPVDPARIDQLLADLTREIHRTNLAVTKPAST